MGEDIAKRIDVEAAALLLLRVHAKRQLGLPKNRAKGVPTETLGELVNLADGELNEVRVAVRTGQPTHDILSELGDVAAFVGLAMWRAMEDEEEHDGRSFLERAATLSEATIERLLEVHGLPDNVVDLASRREKPEGPPLECICEGSMDLGFVDGKVVAIRKDGSGGFYLTPEAAIALGRELIEAGAVARFAGLEGGGA